MTSNSSNPALEGAKGPLLDALTSSPSLKGFDKKALAQAETCPSEGPAPTKDAAVERVHAAASILRQVA